MFAAGTLDPSFGLGGTAGLKASLIGTSTSPSTTPTQLAVDAAGRTLIVTTSDGSYNIKRLTADGMVDTRFASKTGNVIQGSAVSPADPALTPRIAIDSTNRIYVCDGISFRRFLSSGKVDRSYGNGGVVYLEDVISHLSRVQDVSIDQSNQLWFTGTVSYETGSGMAVGRLTPDGQPRMTGVYHDIAATGRSIRVLTDGTVIAAGITQITSEVANTVDTQTTTGIIKFKAKGQLDKSYGRNGRRTFALTGTDSSSSTAAPVGIRSDGSVVLFTDQSGAGEKNVVITAAGRDGGDIDFSPGSSGLSGVLRSAQFVRQADGKEIVVDLERDAMARFNADNSVDTTFNGGTPLGNAAAATVATDGSVLYAGTGSSATDAKYYVRRVFGSEGPAARLVPTTLIAPARALPFRVVYRDDDGVNVSTVTGQELRVVSPDGTIARAVLNGVTERDGNVIADYAFRPAGGLNDDDNGVYAVRLRGGSVFDINGNAAELRTIGSLVIRI